MHRFRSIFTRRSCRMLATLSTISVLSGLVGATGSGPEVAVALPQLFPVAGSLNSAGPRLPGNGIATSGWLTDAPAAPELLPDGSFLMIHGASPDAIIHVTTDGRSKIVAGYLASDCAGDPCAPGPEGDGGPAVKARLASLSALAASPDGGFLFAQRDAIRRVDPRGVISTVAGTPSPYFVPRLVGVDGPAVRAALPEPSGVAVTSDGGFAFGDGDMVLRVDSDGILRVAAQQQSWDGNQQVQGLPDGGLLVLDKNHLQRIAPDGGVSTVAQLRFPAVGIAALADGSVLTINAVARRVMRLAPDGQITTVIPASAFHDFAGRGPTAASTDTATSLVGLAADADGIFIATSQAVLLAPTRPSRWQLTRIVDARVGRSSLRVRVAADRASEARLWIQRRSTGRVFGRRRLHLRAGTHWVAVAGPVARPGRVRIVVRTLSPGLAEDAVSLVLGRSLSRNIVTATENAESDDPVHCRSIMPRRVDCWWISLEFEDCGMLAVTLGQDGLLRERDYNCIRGKPRYRIRPRWTTAPTIVPLG
jgi:hypothetical protein